MLQPLATWTACMARAATSDSLSSLSSTNCDPCCNLWLYEQHGAAISSQKLHARCLRVKIHTCEKTDGPGFESLREKTSWCTDRSTVKHIFSHAWIRTQDFEKTAVLKCYVLFRFLRFLSIFRVCKISTLNHSSGSIIDLQQRRTRVWNSRKILSFFWWCGRGGDEKYQRWHRHMVWKSRK